MLFILLNMNRKLQLGVMSREPYAGISFLGTEPIATVILPADQYPFLGWSFQCLSEFLVEGI